ncbi:MAG: 5-formyltetrahydrofolate cyclo-ligase [Clostridia bacterium]|nr:5-formyltetrahydrofolate cyclo-ligase [Clostridia bacterium]MBR6479518.1 5-formyltetrahydrofolate cyclo-ligase [Clostridia bacterium]MBR6512392.1 5-formyltetrahydrofolate cyclo-ligase [Clostridia bacterium]
MNKKEIRTLVKEKKSLLNEEEIRSFSAKVSQEFLNRDFYEEAEVLYAYLPYNQEIRTEQIINQALKDGKKVAVPKVLDDGLMEFYEIKAIDECEKSEMGIPEPKGDTPPADDEKILMLMPGVAFDEQRNRIGYGGGYYDRYLERNRDKEITKVALAYPFQIFPEIPADPHDEKVDEVITV